jgi:gliding motility-associated-like protein
MGMNFQAQNGAGRATGTFTWQPTCAANVKDGLEVHFQLAETAVCNPVPQERIIRFEVVPVATEVEFLPPNVITPNGDGKNDFFTLPTLPPDFCGATFASVRIFTRWGQQVYTSPERSFSWGGAGAAGNYFYLVTYTDGRKFKGWLEVLP